MSSVNSTRRRGLLFGGAFVVALVIGGLLLFGGSLTPATPQPAREISAPVPNTASLEGAESTTLFNRLTFQRPTMWETGTTNATGAYTYTDTTSCNPDAANCSTISFVDLTSPEMKEFFGDNPLDVWAKDSCPKDRGELEGSKEYSMDGETARYYRLPCGVEGELTGHAWLIPGKDVLVMTYAGSGGSLSPEILRGVMDGLRWV